MPIHEYILILRPFTIKKQLAERLASTIAADGPWRITFEFDKGDMEMALRLGTFLGNGAELWLGMQHDLVIVSRRLSKQGSVSGCLPPMPSG